jgi:hypothetical protein
MLVLLPPRIRALANLGAHVSASAQSLRAKTCTLNWLNAKGHHEMRYRTAVKTGRTAALQAEVLSRGSFVRYSAMVQGFSAGYIRPLVLRLPAPKAAP